MRLICDEMLGRLARLLRSAGHDTLLAEAGAADARLLETARREGRRLITRDRRLAADAGSLGVLLSAEDIEGQARQLAAAIPLDWLAAPFSRCVMDNSPLRPATAAEVSAIPGDTAALPGPFNACPTCSRVYWPGSHVKRTLARLTALASVR